MISVVHMIIFGPLYLDFTTWEANSSFTLTCLALHSLLLLDVALVLSALHSAQVTTKLLLLPPALVSYLRLVFNLHGNFVQAPGALCLLLLE